MDATEPALTISDARSSKVSPFVFVLAAAVFAVVSVTVGAYAGVRSTPSGAWAAAAPWFALGDSLLLALVGIEAGLFPTLRRPISLLTSAVVCVVACNLAQMLGGLAASRAIRGGWEPSPQAVLVNSGSVVVALVAAFAVGLLLRSSNVQPMWLAVSRAVAAVIGQRVGTVMLSATIFGGTLPQVSELLGVYDAPSLLWLVAAVGMVVSIGLALLQQETAIR